MSEMIDKVAMAIASELDEGTFYNSPAFQKAARAAIEAMRTPTPAMMEAGYRAKDKWPSAHCDNQRELHRSFAEPRWVAMIDAALKP